MSIVVAVNGEREEDRVLSVAAELAEAMGEDLVAIHVMPKAQFDQIHESASGTHVRFVAGESGLLYTETSDRDGGGYFLDDATEDAAAVADRVVVGTLGEDATVSTAGRVGEVAEEILEEAERRDARYLVVGGRKRSPVGKAVFGSITQSILLDADCPVLTVLGE